MLVYQYDKRTKEYKGTDIAYLDPVATEKAGEKIYAMPAYTTTKVPPEAQEGQARVFEDNKWNYVLDLRGTVVYNVATRESLVWTELGDLPEEYTTCLPEQLDELKELYLKVMKTNFDVCMVNTKIQIPSTNLYFTYESLERLKKEQNVGIQISRDDNNNIYSLTSQEYDAIINYMVIYGQYMYIQKWTLENLISSCIDIDTLKTYKNQLEFNINLELINQLAQKTEEERKAYFEVMVQNI